MTSVGTLLRTERERQGRGTAEIAEELCITQRYLRAMEEDDLKSLPGTFFYKSFVKQYAAMLGMEEKTVLPGIEALVATLDPPALPGAEAGHAAEDIGMNQSAIENGRSPLRTVDPIVRDSNRRYFPETRWPISLAGLVMVLLACSGFYAWWSRTPSQSVRAESPVTAAAAVPVKNAQAQPAALNVSTSTGPDGVNRVVLNLSATEATWLSITCDGKRIFSGILQPSQTKTLSGSETAKMKVGNAGGLEVLWNGKPIGPIGPRGQVREVQFTPDTFEILQPATKPL